MTASSVTSLGGGCRADVLAVDDLARRSYAEGHAGSTVFHTPRWSNLIADCYGFRPFVLAVRDPDGRIVGGLPVHEVRLPGRATRWVAGAYADECGPLADDAAGLARLQQAVLLTRRDHGVRGVVVRGSLPGPGSACLPLALLHKVQVSPDVDLVRASYRKKVAWSVRRARAQVRVRTSVERDDLVTAYYRLHVLTRNRLGVPAQPRRYFALLWERFLATGNGFVELATLDGEVVAGAVFLVHGQTVTYKYSGSTELGKRTRASYAMLDRVITRAGAGGALVVDLGRTDFADTGLQSFKCGWGAETSDLIVTHLGPMAPPAVRDLHPAVRRTLRRLPPLACRVVGEALYRYAA